MCRGQITERDIAATLTTACIIADGTGNPITDLSTHGTCKQRVTAVSRGIRAYLGSEPALVACSI